MRQIQKFVLLLIMLMLILSMQTFAYAEAYIDWENGVIRAHGMAMGPKSKDFTNSFYRAHAREAARMDAFRNLAEFIENIPLNGFENHDNKNFSEHDNFLKLKVSNNFAICPQTKTVRKEFTKDGICELIIEADLFGKDSVAAKLYSLGLIDKNRNSFPKPTNVIKNVEKYTGVVVDCRGLSLNPVMFPEIKNLSGTSIYSYKNLNPNKFITYGVVTYVNDINKIARAGNNPLIVKAIRLENKNTNPVISITNSDKILTANKFTHFLNNCAVVFVR